MTTLLDLDIETLSLCLGYLSPKEVALQVALVNKRFSLAARSDLLWGIFFLREFGHDYWGENAGRHPYTTADIPPFDTDMYKQIPVQDVISVFSNQPQWRIHDTDKIPLNLPHYLQNEADGGWMQLFRDYAKMVQAWHQPADEFILVAGLASSGKSTMMRWLTNHLHPVIPEDLKHEREFFSYFRKDTCVSSFDNSIKRRGATTESYSTPGGCTLVRGLKRFSKACYRVVNVLEIRKPRNWYPSFRSLPKEPKESGLDKEEEEEMEALYRQYGPYNKPRKELIAGKEIIYVIYVIDCAKLVSREYQEEVYVEFHGMCGEAAGCIGLNIVIFLTKTDREGALGPEDVRKLLKFEVYEQPQDWCPHYAGPVVLCMTKVTLKEGHTDLIDPEEIKPVKKAIGWLMKQPNRTPAWQSKPGLVIGILPDGKEKEVI